MNSLREMIRQQKTEEFIAASVEHDLYSGDHNGNTLLHFTAIENAKDIADFLLRAGLYVDIVNHRSITPLHMAAMFNNTETALFLLERGANPNERTTMDITPLHYAAQRSNKELIEALIKRGADMQAQTTSGITIYGLANGYSANLINEVIARINETCTTINPRVPNSNIVKARTDFSSVGVISFSPEMISNRNYSKIKMIDEYYITSFRGEVVQMQKVCLPKLKTEFQEIFLHSITEKRAFKTINLLPMIAPIFIDEYHYGLLAFHSDSPCIELMIEGKYELCDQTKWKIILDVAHAVDTYLRKIDQQFSDIFLNPTTVYFDTRSQSGKLEVFGNLPFDLYSANIHFPEFTAPEVLNSQSTIKTDAQSKLSYSLGALIYYIFTGEYRFKDLSEFQTGIKVAESLITNTYLYEPIFVNEDINMLMRLLLTPNPIGKQNVNLGTKFDDNSKSKENFSRPSIWQIHEVRALDIIMSRLKEDEKFLMLRRDVKEVPINVSIKDSNVSGVRGNSGIESLNQSFKNSISVQSNKRVSIAKSETTTQSTSEDSSSESEQKEVEVKAEKNSEVDGSNSEKNSSQSSEPENKNQDNDSSESHHEGIINHVDDGVPKPFMFEGQEENQSIDEEESKPVSHEVEKRYLSDSDNSEKE